MSIPTLIFSGKRQTLPVDVPRGHPVLRFPLPVDTDDGLQLARRF